MKLLWKEGCVNKSGGATDKGSIWVLANIRKLYKLHLRWYEEGQIWKSSLLKIHVNIIGLSEVSSCCNEENEKMNLFKTAKFPDSGWGGEAEAEHIMRRGQHNVQNSRRGQPGVKKFQDRICQKTSPGEFICLFIIFFVFCMCRHLWSLRQYERGG